MLVEAIIASSVLIMGFMGILALLSRSLSLNRIATDNYRGSYLASEGIEIVKNMLDHNTELNIAAGAVGTSWDSLQGFATDAQTYVVDYTSTKLSINTGKPLDFDPTTGFYSYANGNPNKQSNFTRTIKFTHIGSYRLDVQSIVTWQTGVFFSSVEADDQFYNWWPVSAIIPPPPPVPP